MFYVALTRAAERVYVCYPETHYNPHQSRGGGWHDDGFSGPSRFLTDRVTRQFQEQNASHFDVESA